MSTTTLKEDFDHAEAIKEEAPDDAIEILRKIAIGDDGGDEAIKTKEQAILSLGHLYAQHGRRDGLGSLMKDARALFSNLPKAKTAKIVRTLLELVATLPDSLDLQIELCKESIEWCKAEKRVYLRQRIQARLGTLLFEKREFNEALELIGTLLSELKRLDDKNLLVEVFLLESMINHELRNLPKTRAALTSARGTANSIYCPPLLQAQLDMESGALHADERDYKTAYSYFLEAFEGFNNLDDERVVQVLKRMYLCKIMSGGVDEVNIIVTTKVSEKFTKHLDIEAMRAIAKAHKNRSLLDFEGALERYKESLYGDLLIRHHITALYDSMLEQNLLRIVEPYSRVALTKVAAMIKLPIDRVESKLSQMVLDGVLAGTLDQGSGALVLFDKESMDGTYPTALKTIVHLETVADAISSKAGTLFRM